MLFFLATFFVYLFPITRESHKETAKEMKRLRRQRSSRKLQEDDKRTTEGVELGDVTMSSGNIVANASDAPSVVVET